MEIKKYKELPHSKSILIADKDAFETFLLTGHENLITELYEDVYLTPDIYQFFVKNLDIKALKRFNEFAKEIEYNASDIAIRSILEQNQIMLKDEGFAVIAAMMNKMDAFIDDPRKAAVFEARSVHVVRPSELIMAATTTERE